MHIFTKRLLCAVLCVAMVLSVAVTDTYAAGSTKLDPEVKRAVTLGLVSSSYLKKPSAAATTKDIETIMAKLLKKRGANASRLRAWNNLANGSGRTARSADSIMAMYYGASYLAKNGIPVANCLDHYASNRWTPMDWDAAAEYAGRSDFIKAKNGSFKYYSKADGWYNAANAVSENDWNFTAATMYAIALASNYSGQYVLPQDTKKNALYINKNLTRAQLALQMVRFYDSFEEKAAYISLASLGAKTVISKQDIAKAKPVPEVGKTGISNEWGGSYAQRYFDPGDDGGLRLEGNTTHYQESDFAALADLGMNYLRLQLGCCSLAYPAYSKDRTKVNQNIVEDIDQALRWAMKYGIHIEISFGGFPDDDLVGYGKKYGDCVFTPPMLATAKQYKAKANLLSAFAKRYANVPAKYLSFELESELSTYADAPKKISQLSKDEMADQFIMLADAVWAANSDRGVTLSADEDLGEWNIPFWSKIAEAGINLDYHMYEPRSFVAPEEDRHVSVSQMIWPNFVDENGTKWTMEKLYTTYIKPYQDLAAQYDVGFKIGESGMFIGSWSGYEKPPWAQKYIVAWAKDFSKCMQKHKISYCTGELLDAGSILFTSPPTQDNASAYIRNATYTKKTYHLSGYTMTYYVNQPFIKALTGK